VHLVPGLVDILNLAEIPIAVIVYLVIVDMICCSAVVITGDSGSDHALGSSNSDTIFSGSNCCSATDGCPGPLVAGLENLNALLLVFGLEDFVNVVARAIATDEN
jgi:hypothetical protein